MRQFAFTSVVAGVLLAIVPGSQAATAPNNAVPRTHTLLYYRMGGGDPAARAANPSAVAVHLGIGAALKLNYSCGKFDIGLSWSTLMNNFAHLGQQVTAAVHAGIAALPLYILQRAQPGLYEIFQTYSVKADKVINAALESCQQMEAQIKAGQDPYAQWAGLAKGEGWMDQANTPNSDIVATKTAIEANGGRKGTTWIGGTPAGGALQLPIKPVNDVSVASYNLTMNQGVTASNSLSYTSTQLPLPKLFPTPQSAADFATSVLGDQQIGTCADVDCPGKGSQAATGLMPKYEAEVPVAKQQLTTALSTPNPTFNYLDTLSAPGVAITPDVIRALQNLPPDVQAATADRLSKEIALARTVDRALMIRNLLVTGMTIPEVQANGPSTQDLNHRIADMNRYIDDLMFEQRVRKEIVSGTSELLLQAYQGDRATSAATSRNPSVDQSPLKDGRVQ